MYSKNRGRGFLISLYGLIHILHTLFQTLFHPLYTISPRMKEGTLHDFDQIKQSRFTYLIPENCVSVLCLVSHTNFVEKSEFQVLLAMISCFVWVNYFGRLTHFKQWMIDLQALMSLSICRDKGILFGFRFLVTYQKEGGTIVTYIGGV